MESAKSPLSALPRVKVPLLKAHATKLHADGFTLQLEGFRLEVRCNMTGLDMRDGDILTLYTEVLVAKPPTGATQ